MSENTTTTKKTTSDSKSSSETKSDSTSSSKESSSSSSTESKSEASSTSTSSGASSKTSAPSRPISYFSSVSTEDYREGWDNIFQSKPKRPARIKSAAKQANGPVTIELSADDLDDELRAALEAAFRRKAKAKRLGYDKLAAAGAVDWRLVCKFKG